LKVKMVNGSADLYQFCSYVQTEHEKKEEAIQKEIDKYRNEKTKLETERKMKQDRMVCVRKNLCGLLY